MTTHSAPPALRPHLRTARLTLRPVAAADETAVVTHLNNLAISGWLARVPMPYTPADFHERIAFKFVDGGDGNMTAMEMLNHMLFHGAYHRGAVGWMIGECGGVPPKEVLTVFLRDHHS